jgi:hypothetical protein
MEPVRSNALSTHRQIDVLMLSDFRFPGLTSHSIAEGIAAQAQAGWSTGLAHINGRPRQSNAPRKLQVMDLDHRWGAVSWLYGGGTGSVAPD